MAESPDQFRVASAVKFDAAGRAVASLEPFYATTAEYQDFDDLKGDGRRGSLNIFDAQGRITCSLTVVFAALETEAASCTSSRGDDAGHRLATAYSYRGETWKGQAAAAGRTVPPQTSNGRGSDAYYDAAGRLVATVDTLGGVTETHYGLHGWAEWNTR